MQSIYHYHGLYVNNLRCFTKNNLTCNLQNMTLAERIQKARKHAGLTQGGLAEAAGISQQAISRLETGEQKTTTDIVQIAVACGVRPEWLAMEEGEMTDGFLPNIENIHNVHEIRSIYNADTGPDIKGRVPLISWVQAGNWTEAIDNLTPGDAEEWFPCPVPHSDKTFVLYVRGESMFNPSNRPSFNDGDLIFVDPERQAHHRSLVVVRLDDNKEATFKQLVVEGDNKYLKALNPAWPGQMIPINGNATICGVVIFKGEKL